MDTLDLLLAHLDDLKVQHDAGINPGPDEIALLFDLHAAAKHERGLDPSPGSLAVPAAAAAPARELRTVPEAPARRAKARGKRVA